MELKLKAIIPQVQYNPRKFTKDLESRYRRLGDQVRRDFGRTVANWSKKPTFFVKKIRGSNVEFIAGTDDDIYNWISKGTGLYGPRGAKYPIVAKNAPMLRFQTGYLAKTTPGVLTSRGPGIATGGWVRTHRVMHPGIKPRKWHEIIAQRFSAKAIAEANAALAKWVRESTTQPTRR